MSIINLTYSALMAAKEISETCRRLEQIGGIQLAQYFDEVYVHAKNLVEILKWKDLKFEIKRIKRLQHSSTCTARKFEIKTLYLKADIQEFYNILGRISKHLYKKFRAVKKSREPMTPLERNELVIRFCANTQDLFEVWEELYQRLTDLEETIHTDVIGEDPFKQIHEFFVHSRNAEIQEPPISTYAEARECLLIIRKNNRKLNLILRETDFELSDLELERFKFIKDALETRFADENILTKAYRKFKTFEKLSTKFSQKCKSFRLENVKKCVELDEKIKTFLSSGNIFLPDLLKEMTHFFAKVFHEYKLHTSEFNQLKMGLKEHWDLYTSTQR
ncbi:PREDICTED: uncharacterized protein LOC108558566 [Nicrophorus vespilloides]|uniref:Uncharacterized protein LOC108558566 n=1 Tax=Nicrophorus vespilloides TaxID=110193 RepID=A0ABM1M8X1_NICVS|nr:PREDICTED: uncharacterized protein LOC108558566 [Nicrophorus vespilloides]